MRNLLKKAPYIRLPIADVGSVLTGSSLEPISRVRGTIDGSNDSNG
jgi:hypothetical protein